ncbi:venom metalloproteinase BumaMPs1-like isoform X2 [Ornithodoros turicata]|uniref:venom metalloproteinase BumaMPs1-like isoform X2 n=1 Tax=Ornithodoros turicata TaxID=34597 RepID=UPI003139A462
MLRDKHCCVCSMGAVLSFIVLCRFSETEARIPWNNGGTNVHVVYPKLLQSRSEEGEHVIKVKDDLILTLSRSEVFAENFVVRTFSHGITTEHYVNAKEVEKNLYHDEENLASVTVKTDGGLRVEGVLGINRRIRPAPHLGRSDESQVAHLIYEVDERIGQERHEVAPESSIDVDERDMFLSDTNNNLPDVIYPEIYIICDHAHAQTFINRTDMGVEYIATFINAVNLRYLSLRNPKVQLRVVGASFHTFKEDSFLIYHNGRDGGRYIEGIGTLRELSNFINARWEFNEADIVHHFTGFDIVGYNMGKFSYGVHGYGNLGMVCLNSRTSTSEDVAGTYEGIVAFAHEIGHVLGCPHDGEQYYIKGAPGSKQCPFGDGYIMSYIRNSTNQFKFSVCCNMMIRYIARQAVHNCLLRRSSDKTGISSTKLPQNVPIRTQCKLLKQRHQVTGTLIMVCVTGRCSEPPNITNTK